VGDKDKDKVIDKIGMLFKLSSGSEIKYNSDGTLPIDVIRTGTWSHWFYGTIHIDKKDLETVIKNFDDGVVGNVVTFNYYHKREKNFGVPRRLRLEERVSKFTGQPIHVLVADTQLTDDGKRDVENGEVLNFSAEIDHNYIHREVIPVTLKDENGDDVIDETGKPKQTYIRKKYGATLLGGAVTNYPFITELNPDGLGGNRKKFKDEQGYSQEYPELLINPSNILDNSDNGVIDSTMFFSNITDIAYNDMENYDVVFESYKKFEEQFFPYPGEHAARIKDPKKYSKFARKNNYFKDGIHAIFGIYKKDKKDTSEVQAIRFDAKKYTVSEAKDWLKKHNFKYIEFEPAKEEKSKSKNSDENVTFAIDADVMNRFSRPMITTEGYLVDIDNSTIKYNLLKNEWISGNHVSNNSNKETEEKERMDKLDLDSPVVKELIESIKGELVKDYETKINEIKVLHDTQVEELKQKNIDLANQLVQQQEYLNLEKTRIYQMKVSNFADSVMGQKASPATKEVIRCGLRGNDGVTIKYFDTEKDDFVEMNLMSYVEKLLQTVHESGGVTKRVSESTNFSNPVSSGKVDSDETEFGDDYVKKLFSTDGKEYVELMKDSGFGGGRGIVSKTVKEG